MAGQDLEMEEAAMEIETLFGLPAHPLLVHAAVVLLPLSAIAVIASAALPRWRRYYAPVALVLALLATGSVGLAQGSGEELEEKVRETELVEQHEEAGDTVLPWAVGLAVVSVAVGAVPFLVGRRPMLGRGAVTAVLVAASLVAGVGATWTVVEVGHSGARATWEDVGG